MLAVHKKSAIFMAFTLKFQLFRIFANMNEKSEILSND